MQNRAASRAGLEIGYARFCTDFCADISGGCAVLTKFLIHLNFRGGFTAAFLHARLAVGNKNACFAGQNRRKMQADFLPAMRFCIALTQKLAKTGRLHTAAGPKRIMKPCIMQTAKCLQKQFCKFSKCGCKTRKTVQHAQNAKLVFVENS